MALKLILVAPLLYLAVVMMLDPGTILKIAPQFLDAMERWRQMFRRELMQQRFLQWNWTRSPDADFVDSPAAQLGMRVGGGVLTIYCLAQFLK